MAGTPRALFVIFEELAPSVVDSAVLDHARAMSARGFADFEIWSFCHDDEYYARSEQRLAAAKKASGCHIRLFRSVRPATPGSVGINARRVVRALRWLPFPPDLIHARGDYAAAVIGAAAGKTIPVLWDCRADCVAEAIERLRLRRWLSPLLKTVKARQETRFRKLAAERCSAASFVSDPLEADFGRSLGKKPYSVIPCAASEDMFFWDPALRSAARQEMGYAETDIVCVYSGSMKHYQGLALVVDEFKRLHAREVSARLLIVTPDLDIAKETVRAVPDGLVRIVAASYGEVNRFLNAADLGFLLREKTRMNFVASPTKFAEYCLAGLPVLVTDAVHDAFLMSKKIGNLASVADFTRASRSKYERAAVATRSSSLLGRETALQRYNALYQRIVSPVPI